MRFFRVLNDSGAPNVWFLDEPRNRSGKEIDARDFTEGLPYSGETPCRVPVSQKGRPVQFSLAAFDMPVVTETVGSILMSVCPDDIQIFPVLVEPYRDRYAILNVRSRAACIDEKRSEIMKWLPEDGRPEKVGEYRMITRLVIDPSLAGKSKMFRLTGWEIALIVSEQVRDALAHIPALGVVFSPV